VSALYAIARSEALSRIRDRKREQLSEELPDMPSGEADMDTLAVVIEPSADEPSTTPVGTPKPVTTKPKPPVVIRNPQGPIGKVEPSRQPQDTSCNGGGPVFN
jgi:hypothetical protein